MAFLANDDGKDGLRISRLGPPLLSAVSVDRRPVGCRRNSALESLLQLRNACRGRRIDKRILSGQANLLLPISFLPIALRNLSGDAHSHRGRGRILAGKNVSSFQTWFNVGRSWLRLWRRRPVSNDQRDFFGQRGLVARGGLLRLENGSSAKLQLGSRIWSLLRTDDSRRGPANDLSRRSDCSGYDFVRSLEDPAARI